MKPAFKNGFVNDAPPAMIPSESTPSLPSFDILLYTPYEMAIEVGWNFSIDPWPVGITIVAEYGFTSALGSVSYWDLSEGMLIFAPLLNNQTLYCRLKVTGEGYADSYSAIENLTTNAGAEPYEIKLLQIPVQGDTVVINLDNPLLSMGYFLDTGGASPQWYTDRPEASEMMVAVCDGSTLEAIAAGLAEAIAVTLQSDGIVNLPSYTGTGGMYVESSLANITSVTTPQPTKFYIAKVNEPI